MTGPEADLVEDGVSLFSADLIVTLSALPAGAYEMTTYHHGNDVGGAGPFDVFLDVGVGESLVASDVRASGGLDSSSATTLSFQFNATGADDVVLRLDGGSRDAVTNGFTLTLVPEPASWVLLAVGIGGLFGFGFLRRCQARSA